MNAKSTLLFCFYLLLSLSAVGQCTVTAQQNSAATCGQCNGSATFAFQGGQPPYLLTISGINTGSGNGMPVQVNGLCAGQHFYSATDLAGNLCTGLLNITISGVGTPVNLTLNGVPPGCPTCTDGQIQAFISGGTPPYFYYWNTGQTTQNISGLGTGVYTLAVYDANGCSDTDTVSLSYLGQTLSLMTGRAYYDVNGDSAFTAGDFPLAWQQIQKQPSGQITYTDSNGFYIFGDTAGTYQLSYVTNGTFVPVKTNSDYTVYLSGGNQSGLDFALEADSMYHSISAYTYIPWPRCNTTQPYFTVITNNGTYIDSGSVCFTFDNVLTPSTWTAGGIVSGQTITFPFAGLLPYETRSFRTDFLIPGPGDTLISQTIAQLVDAAGNVLDMDSSAGSDIIRCSFDPNDKQVTPVGDGPAHIVPMNTELRYLIRFQNTGNDTAYNVMIADTIDPGLDLTSVYVIATSHPAWFLKDGGNVLKIFFDNIYLPDSTTNEEASHGYVLLRAFGNPLNTDPTEVYNDAAIIFDLNPPIATNSVFNTFSNNIVGVEDNSAYTQNGIMLMPNPADESTMVIIENTRDQMHRLTIRDINRRIVQPIQTFNGSTTQLHRDGLQTGMYILTIEGMGSGKQYVTRLMLR